MRVRLYNGLPIVNLCIASAAITFQVGVLYPWHHILSSDIKTLSLKVESLEKTIAAGKADVGASPR